MLYCIVIQSFNYSILETNGKDKCVPIKVFSVFNITISHVLTFRKLRCDIVTLFLKNGIFRNIPTVGTLQKSAANHAFPPWESSFCSVLSMCLLRSCDERHHYTFTKRAVLTLFSCKSLLNPEINITISHHNPLTISQSDIVILFSEKTFCKE